MTDAESAARESLDPETGPHASRRQFLAEAGAELASSLDTRATLERVARLAVPRIADYCIIDVLEGGRLHRRGAAHVDPAREDLLEAAEPHAPDPRSASPAIRVLESGEPELVRDIDDAWLERVAQSPEHLRIMRRLEPRSAIIVPLMARGRAVGILWLALVRKSRRYTAEDLALAEELGRRAGIAVDNAGLYREAREARGHAERRTREEEALRRAIAAVSASTSTEEVIGQIADGALTATNADGAFVEQIVLGEDAGASGGEVVVVAVAGEAGPELGDRARYPGSVAADVVEREKHLVIERVGESDLRLPRTLEGSRSNYSGLAVPLLNGGAPIGALILLRGEEKRAFREDEVERARSFADLAALAFHKIHMLEESEQRREELERVMESRTRLMRGFSHDVKNPLGAAEGFLALLQDGVVGELSDPQRQTLGKARRSIGTALGLIEDLLELARAESGQVEIQWAPVDVREAVRELAEEYRLQAEEKGLDVSVSVPEEMPVVESDPARVRQILANLISNAVKYTDQGRVDVVVGFQSGEEGGERVETEVRDTGSGIPAEKQRLLFQEFARLDPGEKHGAGIGLAISRNLARALGGDIEVQSAAGRGSVFTLWLPMRGRPEV